MTRTTELQQPLAQVLQPPQATALKQLQAQVLSPHEEKLRQMLAQSMQSSEQIGIREEKTKQMLHESQLQDEQLRLQQQELRRNKAELQETISMNAKLLSVISHDIRGPFATLKGLLNLYNNGMITNEELKTYFSKIESLIENTDMLFSNILQWSACYVDNDTTPAKIDLRTMVQSNVDHFRTAADRKLNCLSNKIPSHVFIVTDEAIINQVLRNLISNAIKFTEGGEIVIGCRKRQQHLEIFVRDNGLGMSTEQVSALFSWEEKRTGLGTQSEKGAGVGLLICKEFVEKVGGHMSWQSKLHEGTTFSFTLPIKKMPGAVKQ